MLSREELMLIRLKSSDELAIPSKADLLLGQVISVGDKICTVDVSLILRRKENKVKLLSVPRITHAYIFKGDANFPCVNLSEIIKIGDLVLGYVKIDWFRPVFISFKDEISGIVFARCSNCGTTIPTPRELDKLVCPVCRTVRRTKVSALYEPVLWWELHILNKVHIYSPVQ